MSQNWPRAGTLNLDLVTRLHMTMNLLLGPGTFGLYHNRSQDQLFRLLDMYYHDLNGCRWFIQLDTYSAGILVGRRNRRQSRYNRPAFAPLQGIDLWRVSLMLRNDQLYYLVHVEWRLRPLTLYRSQHFPMEVFDSSFTVPGSPYPSYGQVILWADAAFTGWYRDGNTQYSQILALKGLPTIREESDHGQ